MRHVVAGASSRKLTTVSRAGTEATINKPFHERVKKIEISDPRHNSKLAKEDGEEVAFSQGVIPMRRTQLWNDMDAESCDDPVMVIEYIADICVYFGEIEVCVFRLIAWTASSARASFLLVNSSSSVSPASSSPPVRVVYGLCNTNGMQADNGDSRRKDRKNIKT
jgi:hypothetical protein